MQITPSALVVFQTSVNMDGENILQANWASKKKSKREKHFPLKLFLIHPAKRRAGCILHSHQQHHLRPVPLKIQSVIGIPNNSRYFTKNTPNLDSNIDTASHKDQYK